MTVDRRWGGRGGGGAYVLDFICLGVNWRGRITSVHFLLDLCSSMSVYSLGMIGVALQIDLVFRGCFG